MNFSRKGEYKVAQDVSPGKAGCRIRMKVPSGTKGKNKAIANIKFYNANCIL
jgi:hypothetical protein